MYTTDNSGLLISMVSVPYSDKSGQFFANEFENGLFKKYKDSVDKHSIDSSTFPDRKYYYQPKAYYIFGDYDLAILSLIDDFSLGSRKFHPGHSYIDDEMNNFNYQVITGFVPDLNADSPTLLQASKDTFLLENNRHPFLSITKLKINNGILIGTGQTLLSLIRVYIKEKINSVENTDYILLDTICNNEMTLLLFSDSYKSITDFIVELRETCISNLDKCADTVGRIKNLLNDIYLNCLYSRLIKSEDLKNCELENLHLFSNTHTILGYDLNIQNNKTTFTDGVFSSNMQFSLEWDIKPGHLKNVINQINKDDKFLTSQVSIGHGVISNTIELNDQGSLPNFFNVLAENESILLPHLRRFKSYPKFSLSDDLLKKLNEVNVEKHTSLNNYLTQLTFNSEEIKQVNSSLRTLNISKVLRERVLKMYSNFNNCIQDNSLFMYFIEIREFLKYFHQTITTHDSLNTISSKSRHNWINYAVDSFEKAYQNRFHQSNRTMNITDFNLEYNGGAQQLISSLDACYKAIINTLSENNLRSFVVISRFDGVDSKRDIVRLNYFHLFQPELFISTITKEAANFQIIRREIDEKLLDEYQYADSKKNFFESFKKDFFSSDIKLELIKYFKEEYDLNKTFRLLYKNISPNFLGYIYADMVSFVLGYNSNIQLYYFWYWVSVLQISKLYTKKGKFKKYYFLYFLTRLILITLIFEKGSSSKSTISKSSFAPPSYILNELWMEYFHDVYGFCEKLLSIPKFNDWCADAIGHVNACFTNAYYIEAIKNTDATTGNERIELVKTITNMKHSEIAANKAQAQKINDMNKMLPNLIQSYFIKNTDIVIKELKEGKVIEFGNIENESPSAYVFKLFTAYLSIVKELANHQLTVLHRDDYGKPNLDFLSESNSNNVFVDPHGGLFISSYSKRRDYFKVRIAFLKSIWDFCLKSKQDLFPKS